MVSTKRELSPKEAVDAAFQWFSDLYPKKEFKHVLLEGIKYDEHCKLWEVTIGFDLGRNTTVANQLDFLGKKTEPIREFRVVRLKADDGKFIGLFPE